LELCRVWLRKGCGRDELESKAAGVLHLAITPLAKKSVTRKVKEEVREKETPSFGIGEIHRYSRRYIFQFGLDCRWGMLSIGG